jgi:DNA ligase-1
MKRFVALYDRLDSTTSTNEKVEAMVAYFRDVPSADAAWALYFLMGQKLKRVVSAAALSGWAVAEARISPWLFDESYGVVGDLAETISLLVGREHTVDRPWPVHVSLSVWVEQHLLPLRGMDIASQREHVVGWWRDLDRRAIFVLCKLLTGAMRVGVSRTLVTRALAEVAGVPIAVVAHRLMGEWSPTPEFFKGVVSGDTSTTSASRPYPFFLASGYEGPLSDMQVTLGDVEDWQLEWKYDGIRAQGIKRNGEVFLWSRGEEMIAERFPEIAEAFSRLPDGTVLDGEVVIRKDGKVLSFAVLQTRIGRKDVSKRVLAKTPAAFIAYDVLEEAGLDRRDTALAVRRRVLERIVAGFEPRICLSPIIPALTWREASAARSQSRTRGVEGLMMKRLDSKYGSGRTKDGGWWKWKVGPYTLDAVLVMAQHGHGKRANLFTDYTFAVWDQGKLVPIAKAYSGLTNAEIEELDKWIRRHTLSRFGPVRAVEPQHVFELGFEGVAPSSRHKSGIAVRFPRILRWRVDKPVHEADTLGRLRRLVDTVRAAGGFDLGDEDRNAPSLFDETKADSAAGLSRPGKDALEQTGAFDREDPTRGPDASRGGF